ncbi:MAG: hypothetical protein H6Q13_2972 [Bacteroidetes bacterium]|nr:hypothetical protein [Bacteroidota bacterium]
MKQIIFCIFSLLLSFNGYAQSTCAKIDTIEGIIVSKYSKNRAGFYCEMPTLFLNKGDTIVFFQKSNFNVSLLKKYPSLKSTIGNYVDYDHDYLFEFSKNIFKHDLTISSFNYHTEEFGSKIVKSTSFFCKDGDEDLYSIYQFTGLVVVYQDFTPFAPELQNDCLCPSLEPNIPRFAILKEVSSLKPLTDKQITEMRLVKSGIRSIEVFYCE